MKIVLFLLAFLVFTGVVIVLLFNFSPGFKRTFGKYFYNWLYGLKWGKARTNNYGYGPAGPEATQYNSDEKHQIQLYREVAASIGDAEWKDRIVLEVGCGRGGGLHFLHHLVHPAHTHGLDFSLNAISNCQEVFAQDKERLHFVQGDAMSLPFDRDGFDIVFNVESSHIYSDQAKFLREVARILKPEGQFLIADYRPLGAGLQQFRDAAQAAGLNLVMERNISKEVLVSCKADTARREALIVNAPAFARNYLQEFAMTDKSKEFAHFEERYYYFLMVFRKLS
jgi:ubiquinone/menaquinone biosynthesis C-methylase UbiE